jgi:hypothetical protein
LSFRTHVLAALLCWPLCAAGALAQNNQAAPLGVGADVVGDDWDAILQLSPPDAHAKAEPALRSSAQETRREARDKKLSTPKEDKRNALPSGYEALKKSWHDPWPESSADIMGEPRALVLHPVGKATTPYVLLPESAEGGFNEAQTAVASQALGSWSGGPSASARLLDLIYAAARHFGVYHVHVVSGVRRDRGGSRHSHGLAADIVLPSVDDEALAAYFRLQGFVGVGVYTRAGFVHIDVRDRSYFWIDRSPPGRRYKIQAVRMDEAKAADEAAVARGQAGFVNPTRLQKALSARSKRKRARADARAVREPNK